MKNLWTPWRMDYVKGEKKESGCIFDKAATKNSDKEHLILRRDQLAVVLLNRFPYANAHLLVAPARHIGDICDLTSEENLAILALISHSVAILRKNYNPDGFNIGLNLGKVAGAGLADHLHFHIVPRWEGDHNFITVLAEIKTIPEHIEQTFDQLVADFQHLPEKP